MPTRLLSRLGACALVSSAASFVPSSASASEAGRLVWPSSIRLVEAALASDDPGTRRQAAAELEKLPRAVQRRLVPAMLSDADPGVRLLAADAAEAIKLPGTGAWVSKWLGHADARIREAGARLLAGDPHEPAVPGLGRVLGDPEARVRAAAAEALGTSGSSDAPTFLLGHLDDNDPEVRQAVINALEELGDTRAVVPLIGRIQEPRAAIRRQAAAALGSLGDARAAGALTVALGDADSSVRAEAAVALGRLGASDAVWSLGALLAKETDSAVQNAIVDALGAIASDASATALVEALAYPHTPKRRGEAALARAGDAALPSLEACLFQSAQARAADSCVNALGAIGGERAGQLVMRALRQAVVPASTALGALGAIGDKQALPTVLEYLTSPKPAERRAAVDAAGALMHPSERVGLAVEPIEHALKRAERSRLEHAALIALLGRTGSPRAASALVPLARATDEYRRAMAIEALGELGRSGADSVLLEALSSQHFPTRWTAAVALRRVGSSRSLGTLLDRIAAAPPGRASTLAMALAGPLGDRPSSVGVKRTVELLEVSSGGLRDALIDALSSVAGSAGSAPLVRLVPVCGSSTRAKVAEVLATHPEARQTLIGLAHDTDPSVRANAVWSLGHVADPSDRELLVARLDDPDVAVASNSVGALALLALRRQLDVREVLCTALGDARSYVVANALSGLTLLGERCTPRVDPSWLLHHHHSDEVRLAAARLLKRRPEWRTPSDSRPLMRCAARDLSGRVAAECSSLAVDKQTTPAPATPWVSVLVHRLGETEPEPRAAFSLVRADGLIRSGMADRLGGVSESNVPAGDIRLTLPAPFSD